MEKRRRRFVELLRLEGVRDEKVLKAFSEIPREVFVPDVPIDLVYSDTVLITHRKDGMILSTSSQPSLMGRIMEDLGISKGDKVLEIGTGTGYNAAIISRVVGDDGIVVTVENERELYEIAKENMCKLGLKNVVCVHGDGYYGFENSAPYDRIFVTVGIDEPGVNLFRQLRVGGTVGFPMNLYCFTWNPYFVMVKIDDEKLMGNIRFDTSFLKAGGNFAWRKNLLDRMMHSRERFNHVGSFSIPRLGYSFLEFLEICSLRLFRRTEYIFIDIEERGYAIFSGRFGGTKLEVYGHEELHDEFEGFFKMWMGIGRPSITSLDFLMRYSSRIPTVEPSHRYIGQNW